MEETRINKTRGVELNLTNQKHEGKSNHEILLLSDCQKATTWISASYDEKVAQQFCFLIAYVEKLLYKAKDRKVLSLSKENGSINCDHPCNEYIQLLE